MRDFLICAESTVEMTSSRSGIWRKVAHAARGKPLQLCTQHHSHREPVLVATPPFDHTSYVLQQSFLVRRMRNPTKCDPANFVTAFRAFGQHPQRLGRLILRSAHIAKTSACICRIVLNFLY